MLDIYKIRQNFPILSKEFNGNKLIYFDNAATTQKPQQVVDAISQFYCNENANVGRSVYSLSMLANMTYERCRGSVQKFINAKEPSEIVFTKGATESINLVAETFTKMSEFKGSEIIISEMEHHSNMCPWQKICDDEKIKLRIAPVNDNGDIDYETYRKMLNKNTMLVAVAHISNTIGTVNPLRKIIDEAHKYGIKVLVDGAQGIAHANVDVRELDCDFYCLSSHKMYGPMGVGVLYGKSDLLSKMPPYQQGGGMVSYVSYPKVDKFKENPHKFEAGTPNVAGAIGLEAAIHYLESIGMDNIIKHEKELTCYALEKMNQIDELRIFGNPTEKSGIISFLIRDLHPYDIGNHLNCYGIAVRTGVHCAIPYVDKLGLIGTVRVSFGLYNTKEEVDHMCNVLKTVEAGEWTLHKGSLRW